MKSIPQSRVLVAFVALAILAGPVTTFVSDPAGLGAQYLSPPLLAAASALAGFVLLAVALVRHERLPRGGQWLALLALLVPQWLIGLLASPSIRGLSSLHSASWGVAFLIALAAPLWLALLSALQWIPDQVPRAVAGAAIAGIGAFCLATPGGAYAVTLRETPVAALQILLAILTVFSWSCARPRLTQTATTATAGCFLLLNAVATIATIPLLTAAPAPLDWHAAALPLLLTAALNAATWLLWFWLLEHLSLAAFGMRALAAWTASVVPGLFVYGLQSWRPSLFWRPAIAVVIAIAALVIALRARTADEQPLALGLASP